MNKEDATEVVVSCPFCRTKIALRSKEDGETSYMACMGNADLINVACSKCGLDFYIYEQDYDNKRNELRQS